MMSNKTNEKQNDKLLTVDEEGEILGVSGKAVYNWVRANQLDGLKVVHLRHVKTREGKRSRSFIRFRRRDVNAWIESRAEAA